MRHIVLDPNPNNTYQVAILLKQDSFSKSRLQTYFTNPLLQLGIPTNEIIAFNLEFNADGKYPMKDRMVYLDSILKALTALKCETILCPNTDYFKALTGTQKTAGAHGYVHPCRIKGYEHFQIILSIDPRALIYDERQQSKLTLSLETTQQYLQKSLIILGSDIIHSARYPYTIGDIRSALDKLHEYPSLTVDVETRDLRFYKAGIETIAFAWDKHNGISFCVEKGNKFVMGQTIKHLLKVFFMIYEGKLIYHKSTYDIGILCYELFMKNLNDYPGMLNGLEILTENVDDTLLIAYLATNTTAGNSLSLKELSHPFSGDYGLDVSDTTLISREDLLDYNLRDCLATWYVYETYHPMMVQDNQLSVYEEIYKPSIKTILNMQLTGMPICPLRVAEVKAELLVIEGNALKAIHSSPIIVSFLKTLKTRALITANSKLKVKQHDLAHFDTLEFNPNSGTQLQILLYEHLTFPILAKTKKGAASTSAATLAKLIHHTSIQEEIDLIQGLLDLNKVAKILNTFIPAFENAIEMGDGSWRIFGNFSQTSTVSGRLASSKINMQQIPSNSLYGKLIKSCFISAPGKAFCFSDFNALEAVVNALLTKDPNKLRPLIEHIDAHCFASYSYYPEELGHILNTVAGLNSIKDLFPELRQESKGISFAAQFMGTWRTFMNNGGLTEKKAKEVEANYHNLYKVADEWVADKLTQAAIDGYVTLAFGLRLRTPLLQKSIMGKSNTPNMTQAEYRTAGNAVSGQSFGMINTKAANLFMDRVYASKYRLDIRIIALIHDAIYLEITGTLGVLEWVNINLIECMTTIDLPELRHDSVKLGAELDICKSWDKPITLPNNATKLEMKTIIKKGLKKYDEY